MQIRKTVAALLLGATAATALAAIGLIVTATAVTATTAGAEPVACGERAVMIERLKRAFGETQTGLGLVSAESVLEVWSSKETGTWTILTTDPNGQSCMVAAGEAWKTIPWAKIALGEPA